MQSCTSTCHVHTSMQRACVDTITSGGQNRCRRSEVGLMKKNVYGTRDAASNWERDWQEHVKSWGPQLGLSSKNPFHRGRNRVSGMTHGDDFVLTGPTKRLTELKNKMTGVYPVKTKIISYSDEHQSVEQKVALGWERNGLPVRSQTR